MEERLATLEKRLAVVPGVADGDRTSPSAARGNFSTQPSQGGRSEETQSREPIFSRERSNQSPSSGAQAFDPDNSYYPFAPSSPRRERARSRCDEEEPGLDRLIYKRARREYPPGFGQVSEHADGPGSADHSDALGSMVRLDDGHITLAANQTLGTHNQIPRSNTPASTLPLPTASASHNYLDSRWIDRGVHALSTPAPPDGSYVERPADAIKQGQSSINQSGNSAAPSTFQLLDRLPRNYGLDLPIQRSSGNSEEEGPAGVHENRAWKFSSRANEFSNETLPPRAQAEHLIGQYLQHTNSTWALLHEPTLYLQLENVYRDTNLDTVIYAFDVLVISSE